jgi:hypothetical protein
MAASTSNGLEGLLPWGKIRMKWKLEMTLAKSEGRQCLLTGSLLLKHADSQTSAPERVDQGDSTMCDPAILVPSLMDISRVVPLKKEEWMDGWMKSNMSDKRRRGDPASCDKS